MHAERSLHILQVVTDRDRRGAQVFATDLEVGLRLAGHHVHTVALARSPFGDALDIDVLGPSRFARATLTALRAAARQADVVVAHGSSTLPACALGLLGTGTPFVYRQISDPEFWASTWPRRMRVAAFLRRAAGVVALAPSAADALVRHYRIARDRMDVSPNAVPADPVLSPDAVPADPVRPAN